MITRLLESNEVIGRILLAECYWQSKISYKSAEEVLEIANKLRETEIPCDVIHIDTNWFKEDWYCDLEFDK